MSPGYLDDLTPPASNEVKPQPVTQQPASNDVKPDPAPPAPPTFSPPVAPTASATQNPYTQWTPSAPRARNPYLYMQHDNGRYILALIVVVLAVGGLGTYLYLSSRGSAGPAAVTVTTTVSNSGSHQSSTSTTVSQGTTVTVIPQNTTPISGLQASLSPTASILNQVVTINGSWQGGVPPYLITILSANTVNACLQGKHFASINTESNSFTYNFIPRQKGTSYYCIVVQGTYTAGYARATVSGTLT